MIMMLLVNFLLQAKILTVFSVANCKLEEHKFLCKDNASCITLEKVCDGFTDCADKSDEDGVCKSETANCDSTHCPAPSKCYKFPSGLECVCPKGYTFDAVKKTCVDIDECENFGVCSQGCNNTIGSYRCTCARKFKLERDGRTCVVRNGEPFLLYTTEKTVVGIYLKFRHRHVYHVAANLSQVVGVDYDGTNIYWTVIEQQSGSIVRVREGGSTPEIVSTYGLEDPEDLAIDWLAGNIYFTDNMMKHLAVCSNHGFHCAVLVVKDVDQPRGIALNPYEGLMFWTDWGKKPIIGRAAMDGTHYEALINKDIHWPNGIALDIPNGRLYWADAKIGTIESALMDGSDRRIVLTDILKHPYGIAVFEDKIYWSDWETKSIHSCHKFTGKHHEVLVKDADANIYDITVYHSAKQPKANHACMMHKCSHLCLLSIKNSSTCACPDGMLLGIDQVTCKKFQEKQRLLLGLGNYLVNMEHASFGRHKMAETFPLPMFIHKIAFNSLNGTAFIADNSQRIIYEVHITKKFVKKLASENIGNVTALAFDHLANNLYWADSQRQTVEVLNLRKMERTIVYHFTDGNSPVALGIIPEEGKMFVTLHSQLHMHIDISPLHGRGAHHHVVEESLGVGGMQLYIDPDSQTVFWLDTDGGKIEFSNYEGSFRHLFRTRLKAPTSMALVEDDLVWTARNSKTLFYTHKSNLASIKKFELEIPTYVNLPDTIPIVSTRPLFAVSHVCNHNNGGCSHICVSLGKYASACLCPPGMVFKDNTNITCIDALDCEFRCTSGECLTSSRRCNGRKDCTDGSDEEGCENSEVQKNTQICSYDQFACHDGVQCIPNEARCDRVSNCNDKSDEQHCETFVANCKLEEHKFLCKDNDSCIALEKVCDGFTDCADKSDEDGVCKSETANCDSTHCPAPSKCYMFPSGPKCVCPKGYTFDAVKKACVDIDECENFGVCSQGCNNTIGSYRCTCVRKFKLERDGRTCVVRNEEPFLLYTTEKTVVGIYLKSRHVYHVATNLSQVVGVDYDGTNIYWTVIKEHSESIVRVQEDGSNPEIVLNSGLEGPEDLAIDWLAGNIYFTDNMMKHVAVCSNHGFHFAVLVVKDVDQPRGIALNPYKGLMFWTDWGKKPIIGRAAMDGTHYEALINKDVHWPNGIALDIPNGRLYWADAKIGTIESALMDGSDRRIVLTDILKHPYGVAVFEDKIYWSDWGTKSIHSCHKFTGKHHEVLVKDVDVNIYGIAVYHSAKQPKANHACMMHKCSHLCLLSINNTSTCACPVGMLLGIDQVICKYPGRKMSTRKAFLKRFFEAPKRLR